MKIAKNIFSNLVSKVWSLLATLIFVPKYVEILGIDNFGIISLASVISTVLLVLEGGLTTSISREFAREDCDIQHKIKSHHTVEALYVKVFLLLAIVVVTLNICGVFDRVLDITTNGLNPKYYIYILLIGIGAEIFFRLHIGALMGLQKQVKANLLLVLWGIMRNAVVVLVISLKSALVLFFLWQSFVTVLFVFVARWVLLNGLGSRSFSATPLQVDRVILKSLKGFAGGMFLIALISVLTTQFDKLLVARYLSITELGYYSLATSAAMLVYMIVSPISTAFLPKFIKLVTQKRSKDLVTLFEVTNVFVVLSSCCFLSHVIVYSESLIFFWTKDYHLTKEIMKIFPGIVIGYTMISIQVIAFNVVVANGKTRINNYMGLITLLIIVFTYPFVLNNFGVKGLAYFFAVLMTVQTAFYVFIVRRLFLPEISTISFLSKHFIVPSIGILGTTLAFKSVRLFFIEDESDIQNVLFIIVSVLCSFLFSSLLAYSFFRKYRLRSFYEAIN